MTILQPMKFIEISENDFITSSPNGREFNLPHYRVLWSCYDEGQTYKRLDKDIFDKEINNEMINNLKISLGKEGLERLKCFDIEEPFQIGDIIYIRCENKEKAKKFFNEWVSLMKENAYYGGDDFYFDYFPNELAIACHFCNFWNLPDEWEELLKWVGENVYLGDCDKMAPKYDDFKEVRRNVS